MLLLGILLGVVASVSAGPSAACAENNWPLCDYVYRDDGMYSWALLGDPEYDAELEVTSYYINMTSQQWKDESWSNWPVWWHYMVVHVPDNLEHPEHGFLYISYRSNTNSPPHADQDHVRSTRRIASTGGHVSAVIQQIPNQPITFTDDPRQKPRYEDDTIAYTWREYMNQYEDNPETADPEVILRMPMCKGAVKAMDTMEDLVNNELGIGSIDKFMLAGESKRGWTTWMTGPIDDRVVAMAPVVLSSLDMHPNFHHYYQSFGGWPLYFWDYWSQGIMGRIDSDAAFALYEIADPWSYAAGMTMPIMMVSSTSDEFFLIDDTHYFFKDLPGNNNYFWLLEDSGHGIGSSPRNADYWEMLGTFYLSVITDYERPSFSWEYGGPEDREGVGFIRMNTDVDPLEIMAFSAPSVVADRRDWRKSVRCDPSDICSEKATNITWARAEVEDLGDGEFQVEYEVPEEGFLAFYMQMRYEGPDGRDMWFTTEANIIPNYFPYPDCSGNCTGILK